MAAAEDKVKLLKQYVEESSSIVFFGGAGVSTESGIPDFRSVDGLYHQEWKYPPETIISHSFFVREPEEKKRLYLEQICCGCIPVMQNGTVFPWKFFLPIIRNWVALRK